MNNTAENILTDESAIGVIELSLILMILVGLVLIFRTQIKSVLDTTWSALSGKAAIISTGYDE